MNDNQLLRYSRHILMPEIGYEGQDKLTKSHALIVGAGGLGSPVALYLAASGVGTLTICDFDVVDLTNLQRQIIHTTQSVGINKAVSAQQTLYEINPDVNVKTIQKKSTEQELADLVAQADVAVSYTHLDGYKRQTYEPPRNERSNSSKSTGLFLFSRN